jgi:anti-sigma factor RsiW
MTNPQITSHERFEADLAELAAGILDRREEATLLNHLASCPNCAAEFEQLASAAKSLLQLVLEIEPPVGFESRLWDRIESDLSDTGPHQAVAVSPGDNAPPVWL